MNSHFFRAGVLVALCCYAMPSFGARAESPVPFDDDGAFAHKAPTLPDLPPSFHSFIPGRSGSGGGNPGVNAPFAPSSQPADKQAAAPVRSREEVLNDLFGRLSKAGDTDEASGIATLIEHVWQQSGSDTADLLMSRAATAIGKGDNDVATRLLDKVLTLDPDWAEAWNRRAILRFLNNDDFGAMDDVRHVLAIEPRHFGALSGMAFILQRHGMRKQALDLLRKVAEIYPHNESVLKQIDELTPAVEGSPI